MNTLSGAEYEALVDDVNKQMASSRLSKRHSRGSGIQTPNRASARIEKPRSTNPSPRRLERRRTTASVKPYVSLDDHYNAMLGPGKTYDETNDYTNTRLQSDYSLTRPMSWHPTSFQISRPATAITGELPTNVHRARIGSNHELISSTSGKAPISKMNSPPKPTRSETVAYMGPSKDDTYDMLGLQSLAAPQLSRATWCVSPNSFSQLPYAQAYIPSWLDSSYSSTNFLPSQSLNGFEIPTAQQQMEEKQFSTVDYAAEPDDFLPMQRPASRISSPVVGNKDSSSRAINDEIHMVHPPTSLDHDQQELIGMGLYDPPESDMSIIRTGLPAEAKGKGLKLEETWKPPQGLLLPKDHDEQDDASSDSGSNVSNGVGIGNNEGDEDFIMDEGMGTLTVSDQGDFFLSAQPSFSVVPTLAAVPVDSINFEPMAKVPAAAASVSAGFVSVPGSAHAVAPAPSSLAGRSFFFDEDEDSMMSRGMDMWYTQLRPATQTATLGTTWF